MHSVLWILLLFLLMAVFGARRGCYPHCGMTSQDPITHAPAKRCKCLNRIVELMKSQKLRIQPYENNANDSYYKPDQFRYPAIPNYYNKNLVKSSISHLPFPPKKPGIYDNIRNATPKNKRTEIERYFPIDNNYYYSRADEVSRLKESYANKKRAASDKHFKDCLDLHAILISRTQFNNTYNGKISERNLIYHKLSDVDILLQMEKKCKELDNINNESILQVKRIQTYNKKILNLTYNNHEYFPDAIQQEENISQDGKITEKNDHIADFTSIIIVLNPETNTLKPSVLSNPSTKWQDKNMISPELLSDESEESSSQDSNDSASLSTPTLSTASNVAPDHTQGSSTSTEDNIEADSFVTYTDILDTTYITAYPETPQFPNVSQSSMVDITTALPYMESTTDFKTADPLLTLMTPRNQNDKNITIFITPHDEISLYNNTNLIEEIHDSNFETDTPVQLNDAIVRTEYFEGEYNIPKLVTAELSNNTVLSEVHGNEEIPNLDFLKPLRSILKSSEVINDINSLPCDDSKNNTSPPVTVTKDHDIDANGTASFNVTGKLYFKYGPDYIPTNFVQNKNALIHVGIELPMICKYNKEQSKLISSLCKCIKSRLEITEEQ